MFSAAASCQNVLRTGKLALNFIPDDRKYFKEAVKLSWPGDTTEEKMPKCKFRLEEGLMAAADPSEPRPKVLTDAFQVIECTWMSDLDKGYECKPGELHGYQPPYHDFNGITSEFGATFILRVDKILMKERYYNAIINGVRAGDFPRVPVDYGYRDSKNFWYTKFRRPIPELLQVRATTLDSVRYAADRVDPEVHFTDEALQTIVNVPRVFLPTVLKGCVAWAKENGVTEVTAEHMKIINDKRSKEKSK